MPDGVSRVVPRLQLEGVAAGYGAVPVLFDVSLTVGMGEVVALLGPNGAGKTTTLRTVAGLVRPRAGSVLVSGQSTAASPPREWPASASGSSPREAVCSGA